MKKIIKTLLVVMVVVLAITALAACEQECQHTGGTATCTEKAVCEICGESYGETLAHKPAALPAIEATCSKEGRTEGTYCRVCNTVLVAQEATAKLEHEWVANVDRDFTCTIDGLKGGNHCSKCGEQDGTVEIIAAHCVWGEDYVHTEPTCGKAGILAHDCTVCGAKEKVADIPATGEHSFTVDVEAKAPTCADDGYTAHKACEVCGTANEEYEAIPATKDHQFNEEDLFYYPEPTCTEGGMLAGTCAKCGNSYYIQELPPQHKYEGGNCTTAGTCSVCGEAQPEAPGHTWTDATCTTPKTCSVCGATEGEALGHTEGAAATCTTAQICTVCGAELVAKLDHIDENGDIECDREGCTSKVAPPADSVLSNFTANNLGSKLSTDRQYYVVGTIVEVLDAKNGVFYLDDGTGEKFYFRLPKNADGVSHSSWEVKLVVGDKVQVYGKINKFTSSSAPNGSYWPAIQGGVVTILEQHPHVYTAKEADCFNPAYCECGKASAEGPKAHVDADTNDVCDNCGYQMGSVVDFIKTHFNDVKETSNYDSVNGTALWESDEFSILVSKGTATFNSNGSNHFRLQKGNVLTITAKNGNKIAGIVFTVTTSSYTDELETVLTTAGFEYTLKELELTVKVDSLDTFVLENTASKIARIASVAVVYIPATPAGLVNATIDLTTKDNRTFYDAADKQVWEQNGIKVTNTKGESTSNIPDKAPFQVNSKGSLIIEGKGMKTIVIVASNTTYGTYFNNILTAVENPNFTYVKSGTTFTITLNEVADIFQIDNLLKATAFKTITINPEA